MATANELSIGAACLIASSIEGAGVSVVATATPWALHGTAIASWSITLFQASVELHGAGEHCGRHASTVTEDGYGAADQGPAITL